MFLRTEEKKRIDALAKQSKETPPVTAVDTLPAALETNTSATSADAPADAISQAQEDVTSANETNTSLESVKALDENSASVESAVSEMVQAEEHDVPQPSIEVWLELLSRGF